MAAGGKGPRAGGRAKGLTVNLDKAKDSKVSSLIDYIWDTNPDLSEFIFANKDNFFENKTLLYQ